MLWKNYGCMFTFNLIIYFLAIKECLQKKKRKKKKEERITLEACGLADFPLFSFLQHKPLFSPPPAPPDY